MSHKDFIEEMADLNMAYLLLLQRMIAEDKPSACVKFGIDESLADWIESLSPTKLVMLARSNLALVSLRFDEKIMKKLAGGGPRDDLSARLHGLIMALKTK